MAAQSVDAATTTPSPCNDAYNLPPGDYRTSAYGGGDFTPGPVTSLYTLFGVLTPGQVNGNWLVCVFDYSPGDTGTVGGTSIFFGAPTAASVTIGGRVLNSEGRGIVNVRVNMTLPNHSIRSVLTGKGGIYQFDNVEVGSVYFLTAVSKNYIFEMPTRVVSLTDAVSDLNFVGTLPHKRQ